MGIELRFEMREKNVDKFARPTAQKKGLSASNKFKYSNVVLVCPKENDS